MYPIKEYHEIVWSANLLDDWLVVKVVYDESEPYNKNREKSSIVFQDDLNGYCYTVKRD